MSKNYICDLFNPLIKIFESIFCDDFYEKYPEERIPSKNSFIFINNESNKNICSPRSVSENIYDIKWKSEIETKYLTW